MSIKNATEPKHSLSTRLFFLALVQLVARSPQQDRACPGGLAFRLDSSKQEADVESARRKIAEVDAQMVVARTDLAKADSQLEEAKSSYQQALDELETKQELQRRSPGIVRTDKHSIARSFRKQFVKQADLL